MSRKTRNTISTVLKYAVLIFGAIFTLLPFLWMILSALKTKPEVIAIPPTFFPSNPQFSNFVKAWNTAPFLKYTVNTLIVTAFSTLGVVITTVLAAYAYARLNFPGKKLMFSLMLATLMIPGEMLVITNFLTIRKLDWMNSYQAMIVPYLASVFYIYLLTQFFSQVPDALYLAAKVDKCGDFKYLMKIMIPINKSPIFTICILNAISCWNSFMWPMLVTTEPEMRVLSYGLVQFQTENGSDYQLIMAASCILVLPIIIVYLLLRKYVIEGVTQSGIKG